MEYLQYLNTSVSIQRDIWNFKPYYNWITFNTLVKYITEKFGADSFKPYYNWITFNTFIKNGGEKKIAMSSVLNLIITGLPSIPNVSYELRDNFDFSFKPYYNWITFNTTQYDTKESIV